MSQIILEDYYFKSGTPWIDVKAYGAIGDNIADDSVAIQVALNAAVVNKASVYLSPGNYKLTQGLTLPKHVRFFGAGSVSSILIAHADIAVITFETSLDSGYSELLSMGIYGYQSEAATQNTLNMPFQYGSHTGHILRDLRISGGYRCMYTFGVDCVFENVFVADCFGPCLWASQGSNWYIRCKFDSTRAITYAFAQAGYPYPEGSMSGTYNNFMMCDFTGPYAENLNFNDVAGVLTMSQCDGLNVVNIINSNWVSFSQCQFGIAINNSSAGTVSVVNSKALNLINIAGSKLVSGNINIT